MTNTIIEEYIGMLATLQKTKKFLYASKKMEYRKVYLHVLVIPIFTNDKNLKIF